MIRPSEQRRKSRPRADDPLGLMPAEPDSTQDPLGLLTPAGGRIAADPGGDIDLRDSTAATGTPAPRRAAPAPAAPPVAAHPADPGLLDRFANWYGDHFAAPSATTMNPSAAALEQIPTETRRVAQPIDRRTVTEQAVAARQQGMQLVDNAAKADVSGTPGAQILPSAGGAGFTTAAAMDASKTVAAQKATAEVQGRFTPEKWNDIARRGMELGSALHAQGKHDEAQDVLLKAYNAQLLASGAKQADTYGAIALSSALGIIQDPYAGQRRNIAEVGADPGLTFTPEEQQSELGINLPAASRRNTETGKDIIAPLVGMAPAFEMGGFLGRGAAAIGGAALERAGAEGIGSALGRLSRVDEAATTLGPRIPLASRSLARGRLEEEVAALRQQLPGLVERGASQGQIVGAIQNYRMARQQGATPEQALAGAVEGAALNVPMGVGAEVGMGLAGRALGLGYDPIGRVWRESRDRIRGTSPEEAVTTPLPPTPHVDAARAAEGKLPTSDMLPGLHRDIAQSLDELLGQKKAETQRNYQDIFAQQDRTPAGPEWWNARSNDELGTPAVAGDQPLGPEPREQLVERASTIGGRRREAPPAEPLPSALEATMRRYGVEPAIRPSDEANAHFRMRRAAMDAEEHSRIAVEEAQRALDDPNLRLEQAAQQRPGEVQGPRTLEETLAETTERQQQGDPMAQEYHDAINKYADAAAAVRDAGEGGPNTRSQIALARAKAALNAVRTKYGKQIGASAVLALAANDSDLDEHEKQMVGLGGVAILGTDVVKYGDEHPLMKVPFTSRLRTAIDALPKKWDAALPAADWIGKLKGTTTFKKEELAQLLPALEEAQRGKVKLTRADIHAIAEERLPKVEPLTLSSEFKRGEAAERVGQRGLEAGHAGHGDPDEIDAIENVMDETDHEAIQQQIDNRAARRDQIEEEMAGVVREHESTMESAQEGVNRIHAELREDLERHGLDRNALDDVYDYIHERVYGDHIPGGVVQEAMRRHGDDLIPSFDPEQLLNDNGYKIKEEDFSTVTFSWDHDGETHSTELRIPAGDSDAEVLKLLQETARDEDLPEPQSLADVNQEHHGTDHEIAVYGYDGETEIGRGDIDDREDVLRDAAEREELESGSRDEAWQEIEGDLERYVERYSEWQEAESNHNYYAEGDGAFEGEHTEIEQLNDEMQQLAGHRDRMEANNTAIAERGNVGQIADAEHPDQLNLLGGEQRALPEVAGQETGRPEGEPVAVVAPPDAPAEEPEVNVIPRATGKTEFHSYQRVPGGKNYREMLNVWDNNPGQPYDTNHYGNKGYSNTVGHVRGEDYEVQHVPGLSGEKVEMVPGEPENVRVAKSQITEVRAKRTKLQEEMAALVQQHAAMPPEDRFGSAAQTLARKYEDLNQRIIDLGNREGHLITETAKLLGVKDEPRLIAILGESQSDWAQDAGRRGIEGVTSPEEKQRAIRQVQAQLDEAMGSGDSERYAELQDAKYHLDQPMVPPNPFMTGGTKFGQSLRFDVEGRQSYFLNAARFLMDAAMRGYDHIGWSDAANRVKNAHLPIGAAKLVYDEITGSAIKTLLNSVGFKDVKMDKVWIRGEGHWHVELTPEMRRAIKKMGLPLMGVAALAAMPKEAQAQTGEGSNEKGLYGTALGGIAAGAALMYLAREKKLRRLVKENRELFGALMVDDLSGLANKKAFLRAKESVNADERFHWTVFDGDRFKKLNDAHGHAEGDKAIQHFGKTVMDVAKEMDIPMRGFRFGGDEIAFAAPAERAAEFVRQVEERSQYTKGDVTTKLTGGYGPTFDVADANLTANKNVAKGLDPSLRRTPSAGGDVVPRPLDLHANPIPQAMRELMKYPGKASIAALGAIASQSDDPDIRATGKPLIALAALSAIGSKRLIASKDFLADHLLQQLKKSEEGTAVARFFNPDALLHPDVKKAIQEYEDMIAKGRARATEFSGRAKELGPKGDRAVSDVIEGEDWENTKGMSAKDMSAVLTFASSLDQEYQDLAAQKVQHGVLDPLQLLPGYAGPRRYAHYEAADVLKEKPQTGGGGGGTRIGAQKSRTLDEPIRDAQRELTAAQASGDKQRISDAQDALDEAKLVQMSQRVERGEIRESSYRSAQGIQKGYSDVAAAKLFGQLRQQPGVAHPDWVNAVDDLEAARQMRSTATTPADRQLADGLVRDAKVKIDEITRKYQQKGGDYVSLPDTPGLGKLRGAVVQRDVANSLQGFQTKGVYAKTLRAWKNVKTIFNPGTHAANIISNIMFSHMEGLPMWEQPVWLKRASQDMRKYGAMTRALAENGTLGVNAVSAEGAGMVGGEMKSEEGLHELLGTTRPETADVLRKQGITEQRQKAMDRKRMARYVAGGAALGAAKMYDDEDAGSSIATGAALGAAGGFAAAKFGRAIRAAYGGEDDIFRIAIGMKKMSQGMTVDQAAAEAKNALGNFRSRSPALQMARSTIAPFLLYPAKVLPRFAQQMVDHPWRYMALIAMWGGLNEYSQQQEGAVPDIDVPPGQRRLMGYFLPGFTQLPMRGNQGERAATDIGRWTPMSAITSGAPPGSIPAALDEHTPDVFRAGGPVVDLAAKFGANVDPFTQKPLYRADYPPRENVRHLLNDVAGTALPSALDVHATNIKEDIQNRDLDKLKNDALGPTGLRPRFIRPGANARSATFELQQSLSQMKQDLSKDLIANKNVNRTSLIQRRYLNRVRQALANYRERLGVEPPPDVVRAALDTKQ